MKKEETFKFIIVNLYVIAWKNFWSTKRKKIFSLTSIEWHLSTSIDRCHYYVYKHASTHDYNNLSSNNLDTNSNNNSGNSNEIGFTPFLICIFSRNVCNDCNKLEIPRISRRNFKKLVDINKSICYYN